MNRTTASLGRRITGYIIDIIPIIIITFIVIYLAGYHDILKVYFSHSKSKEASKEYIFLTNNIRNISFFIYCIYCTFLESSKLKGTLGKYVMKIEVVKADGSPLTLLDSVKRNLFKIISYFPYGFGYMWVLVNKNRYAWHDYFAQTVVVNREQPILEEKKNEED
jgi:Predicted membrane protein/domain